MPVTTTKSKTIQQTVDAGNANEIADAARRMRLGTMLRPIKVTFAALTAASAVDITTQTSLSKATVNQGDIPEGYVASKTPLPPIGVVRALRVTAGTAAAGARVMGDSGSTPAQFGTSGVYSAKVSDDGKTVTFEANVTGFVLEYLPRSSADMALDFAPST